LTRARVMT